MDASHAKIKSAKALNASSVHSYILMPRITVAISLKAINAFFVISAIRSKDKDTSLKFTSYINHKTFYKLVMYLVVRY